MKKAENILIVTQAVDLNDPILGFFHRWLIEFAKNFERVEVICLREGAHDLPENIIVHTLGKHTGASKLRQTLTFFQLIVSLRKEYDCVFVHMNQIYVLLGGLFWRLTGKRIGLWYVHKQVSLSLRIATLLTNVVFTAAPESFRVKTNKVRYVGHGIDVEKFMAHKHQPPADHINIIHVGRITEIKNVDVMIDVLTEIAQSKSVVLNLYGSAMSASDEVYLIRIKQKIADRNVASLVKFNGHITNDELPVVLATATLSINLPPTGGLDKAVIESAAAAVPVFTTNQGFKTFFGTYSRTFLLPDHNPETIAQQIVKFTNVSSEDQVRASQYLREQAQKMFAVQQLIPKITQELRK